MKILVIVSSAGIPPWEEIELKGQRETFAKQGLENRFLWYSGQQLLSQKSKYRLFGRIFHFSFKFLWGLTPLYKIPYLYKLLSFFVFVPASMLFSLITTEKFKTNKPEIIGDKIIFSIPSTVELHGLRSLLMMDYVLKNFDFDFLYRINSTSYIDVDVLQSVFAFVEPSRYYGGIGYENNNVSFRSGAGNILSRDVVEQVLKYKVEWKHFYPEDMALGELISRYSLAEEYDLPRVDFKDIENIPTEAPIEWSKIFHFRCKTGEANKSILIMQKLHEIISHSQKF